MTDAVGCIRCQRRPMSWRCIQWWVDVDSHQMQLCCDECLALDTASRSRSPLNYTANMFT